MERIWNYFFYSTWKVLFKKGEIVSRSIFFIMFNLFPFLRKNEQAGQKELNKFMNNKDSGLNIGFAYNFMLLTTLVIYTSFCLIVVQLLNIVVGDAIYYYYFIIAGLSYLTNYLFLYHKSKYIKYFKEFEKIDRKVIIYISAVLFHLTIFCLGVLTIHFTVGFDF